MATEHTDTMSSASERIQRTEAYAEKVRKMFAATVDDILALNKTLPKLADGTMYSFDAESLKKQEEVERLLRRLHSAVVMAIKQGISLEWEQANEECDKLVSSVFGKEALTSGTFVAWTRRNEDAMQSFIDRTEGGLSLSGRVWQSVRQLRDEMEVAMTVGIGEGQSAAQMGRKVRQYLNDPDLMFRRFRYKDKDGNWQLKWKKRVKDEDTGKYKWIDYDKKSYQDEWTGKGYYKSSAQNAMRVTRTETNIAYRRADHARWSQMDFVLGQRVRLSHNHPRKDICDKLQGDYPKEFVFDGWHPQCFCYAVPITDEAAIRKWLRSPVGSKKPNMGKPVTEYPEAFKDWVRDHADDIRDAREAGKEPYFIRNNAKVIDNILNPKKQLTPLERAKIRHAARTPEQRQAILDRWNARKRAIILVNAAKRHAARIQSQINAIKQRWNARKTVATTIHAAIRKEYKTFDDINRTFRLINSSLPEKEKWFRHGDMNLLVEKNPHNNGSTAMDGNIWLRQDRIDKVMSAFSKIGRNMADKITKSEADAMATLWHEITHNRNIPGNMRMTDVQKDVMEMMNEFVARKTLPEFYATLGLKEIPYPEFINNRDSTGYNWRVLGYDFVIKIFKLDANKILQSAKRNLFMLRYTDQSTTAIQALIDGGLNKVKCLDGKQLSKRQINKLINLCRRGVHVSTIENWMKNEKIIAG